MMVLHSAEAFYNFTTTTISHDGYAFNPHPSFRLFDKKARLDHGKSYKGI